jgi:protein-S-isoprenylcysteine O-methyltransferase Ste14
MCLAETKVIEGFLVVILFLGYSLLWRMKRRQQQAETGIDPEVIYSDQRPTQHYFARMARLMTVVLLLLIFLHAGGIRKIPGFYRLEFFDMWVYDGIGFVLGLLGLLMCWVAQRTMGAAWRVGIDQQTRTPLITTGVFAYIRNPTYSGLLLLCLGAWIILPSFSLLTWCLVFFVMFEFQVRTEEEFLMQQHGEEYADYCTKTKRYIPFVY